MSGHSQFANIKHRKAAQDQKRSKIFQKLSRELTTSAKSFGSDPAKNSQLRMLLEKARSVNMPKENITKAINKATNPTLNTEEEVLYECFGPFQTAFIVNCLTDNKTRTVAVLKAFLVRNNAKLAMSNAAMRLFTCRGSITLNKTILDEEKLLNLLIDFDNSDYSIVDEQLIILCNRTDLITLYDKINDLVIDQTVTIIDEIVFVPLEKIDLNLEPQKNELLTFIENLTALDDVIGVFHNVNLSSTSN